MKQTLAILTESENSAVDWVWLFKDRNCKLLICTDCTEERLNSGETFSDENVSYEPCAKDAAWEADLLLIESGLTPLNELLPRLSKVTANKLVLLYSQLSSEETRIAEKMEQGLPYSTLGWIRVTGDDFIVHLINDHNLIQAQSLLKDLKFPFLVKTKTNEQNYQN